MDLERLHDAVRILARGEEVPPEVAAGLLPEEAGALATLRGHVQRMGGEIRSVLPPAGSALCWIMPGEPEVAP